MIGPSGCGKSTLLRVLNRMYDLYPGQRATGEVMMDGENIIDPSVDLNALRARIGMVFQKPTPFPMTIYDNIAFGVKLHEKLSKAEMDERVEWSLTRGALWDEVKDRLHTSAMGLSGGQQQRLCIARTIAVRPEVILFDEPTSALDPISTLKIEELIDELKHDFTIAIVTHNMQQAARCADQVAFFYLGEMVEVAPAAQMFTAPQGTPHPGIHHRPVRLIGGSTMSGAPEHLVKSYDQELKRLRNMMTQMGGIVETPGRARRRCDHAPRRRRRHARGGGGPEGRCAGARGRDLRHPPAGAAPAGRRRPAPDRRGAEDHRRPRADRRLCRERRQALDRAGAVLAALFARRPRAHGAPGAGTVEVDHRRARRQRRRQGRWRSGAPTRWSTTSTTRIFRELITYMMEDPRNITPCTHLLFIAKNLERIGDHATNVAENLYYAVKGESLPDARPKGDTSAYAVVRPRE